jgi:hypothetical protein
MNPYLEQPEFWSDFHNQLIATLARVLIPVLLPKYRVVIDKWIYRVADSAAIAVGRPDIAVQQSRAIAVPPRANGASQTVAAPQPTIYPTKVILPLPEEIHQAYLEVRDVATQMVVTTVEILSLTNKRGEGRQKYEAKRQHVLASLTNLVEIDLLRAGDPLPMSDGILQSHYRILVSDAHTRPVADLYTFNLSDRIPTFPLPLQPNETEPIIDLQSLLNDLYEQLAYDYFIDYRLEPPLPWSDPEVADILRPRREASGLLNNF